MRSLRIKSFFSDSNHQVTLRTTELREAQVLVVALFNAVLMILYAKPLTAACALELIVWKT